MKRSAVTALLVLLCGAAAVAATFGTRPDSLTIDAKHPVAQLAFSSLNARPVIFDVTVTPADGVLVVPPVFAINPYDTVLLRVTLRRPAARAQTGRKFEIKITEVLAPGVKRAARVITVPLSVEP